MKSSKKGMLIKNEKSSQSLSAWTRKGLEVWEVRKSAKMDNGHNGAKKNLGGCVVLEAE